MSAVTKLMTAGGGGVNLTPASSIASDVTVNVPSVNGTLVSTGSTAQVSQAMLASGVAGNGPAFSAYASAQQSTTSGVWTKVQFDTKIFDTNTNYSTSNYRFTPTVAGYYQINAVQSVLTNSAGLTTAIYKTGVLYAYGNWSAGTATSWPFSNVSSVLYLNGSTDYVEIYVVQASGGSLNTANGSVLTYFNGAMVRAA